jgi:hypothetical protein
MQHFRVRIRIKRVVRLSGQADAMTKPCANYDSVSDRDDRKLRTWWKGYHNEQPHNSTNRTAPSNGVTKGTETTREPE